jgi:multidrug efflux pump
MQTSFLPEEDQANLFVSIIMPAGTTIEETRKFSESVMAYVRKAEAANIDHAFMVVGRNQSAGTAQNVAQGFITLKNWDERPGADRTAAAITQRLNAHLFQIYEGQAVALAPPAIRGLGTSAGFEMWLQDANGQGAMP